MGYSVYIKLNEAEQKEVKLLLEKLSDAGKIGTPTSMFGEYTSDPRMENLGYCEEPDGTFVGCDYGDHDIAHTFINWMGTVLGKKEYCYDDDSQMLPVKPKQRVINTDHWKKPMPYPGPEGLKNSLGIPIPTKEQWDKAQADLANHHQALEKTLHHIVDNLDAAWKKVKEKSEPQPEIG